MEHFSGTLQDVLSNRLTVNIKLDWKDLQGTTTLVYYENLKITVVKKFYNIDPKRRC